MARRDGRHTAAANRELTCPGRVDHERVPVMSLGRATRLWRTARSAYSPHPVAKSYRAWRYFAAGRAADIVLLPLTLMMLTLFLLGTVPGASDMIAVACSIACMP